MTTLKEELELFKFNLLDLNEQFEYIFERSGIKATFTKTSDFMDKGKMESLELNDENFSDIHKKIIGLLIKNESKTGVPKLLTIIKNKAKKDNKEINEKEVQKKLTKFFDSLKVEKLKQDFFSVKKDKTANNYLRFIQNKIIDFIKEEENIDIPKRNLSINYLKKVDEKFASKSSFLKDVKEVSKNQLSIIKDETVKVKHPNGENSFPDYRIYLRNDDIGNNIRQKFNVNSDKNFLDVDVKSNTRIVGKQKGSITKTKDGKKIIKDPRMIFVSKLKENQGVKISINKMKEIMEALDIYTNKSDVVISPSTKKYWKINSINELEKKLKEKDIDKVYITRTGKGAFRVTTIPYNRAMKSSESAKNVLFGFEIGSDEFGNLKEEEFLDKLKLIKEDHNDINRRKRRESFKRKRV